MIYLASAFLAANLLHTLDHLRQGVEGLSTEIVLAGSGLTVGAIVVLVLVARGHRWAPRAAAAVGLAGALGVLASHVAPHWSALSDPYADNGADALSWLVMLIEVATAAALAIAGLRALSPPRAPTPRRG